MPRNIPYLQRRGNTFSFRIAVPADVRQFLFCREITKALDTGDKRIAVPRCLLLAAKAKQLFYTLRQMSKEKKPQREDIRFDYTFEINFDELGKAKNMKVEAEPHEQEAVTATIAAALGGSSTIRPTAPAEGGQSVPMLADVAEKFLAAYPKEKDGMLKKHHACIPAFCEVAGDIRVDQLRRAHVKEFFDLLHKLPPRWADIKRKHNISIRQITEQNHDVLISEKTFTHTYKTSIAQFLLWSRENFGEHGFVFCKCSHQVNCEVIRIRHIARYELHCIFTVSSRRLH